MLSPGKAKRSYVIVGVAGDLSCNKAWGRLCNRLGQRRALEKFNLPLTERSTQLTGWPVVLPLLLQRFSWGDTEYSRSAQSVSLENVCLLFVSLGLCPLHKLEAQATPPPLSGTCAHLDASSYGVL